MVLAVVGSVLAGVALGTTTTTLPADAWLKRRASKYALPTSKASAATPPAIKSPAAIVVSMDTGKVLYERNAHTRRPMASTTKIMTAILILESGVDLSTPVTVSAKAADNWEPSVWVRTGDVLTVEQFLYALMLRSANGAAVALAENDAGSVSAFVGQDEPARPQELGMDDTHFVTTNGLDADGHYSTAADMAMLGRYAMKNEKFREIVDTEKYTFDPSTGEEPLVLTNTNKLLPAVRLGQRVSRPGLTPNADQCLVASGTKDGREVISVVLGQPDSRPVLQGEQGLAAVRPRPVPAADARSTRA